MAGDFGDIGYVQAAHFGGVRGKTRLIVMHATDNTASDEGEVSYAAHRPDSVSAHFTDDSDSIYQSVPLDRVAYGCLFHGNQMSVQFEQCGKSGHIDDATMRRAAAVVRRVCDKYGIPKRYIGASQVRAAWYGDGAGGICGHADVTVAFPEDHGDHMDPGWSLTDWTRFIGYVNGDDDVAFFDDVNAKVLAYRIDALTAGRDVSAIPDGPMKGEHVWLVEQVKALGTKVDALASGGTSVDTQAVVAAVNTLAAKVDALTVKLAEATKAAADKLGA